MQNYIYFDPTKYLKNFEQYWKEREHASNCKNVASMRKRALKNLGYRSSPLELPLMRTTGVITKDSVLSFVCNSLPLLLACVASDFVWFRSKKSFWRGVSVWSREKLNENTEHRKGNFGLVNLIVFWPTNCWKLISYKVALLSQNDSLTTNSKGLKRLSRKAAQSHGRSSLPEPLTCFQQPSYTWLKNIAICLIKSFIEHQLDVFRNQI